MTNKQKAFVDEYLIDLNATRAYKAVYKNVKSDDAIANMLFKKQVKERAYKSTYSKIKTIEKALDHIEKDGERETDDKQLLLYYYVDKLGDDRTAEKLNISRSSFYRRKYIAITRFARQFFGVEVK